MEKPTAASTAEIRMLRRESEAAGRLVFTGLKKIFTPVAEKLKSIITAPEFGPVSSISVRYPQAIPAFEDRGDLNAMRGFLDHIYHPAAILGYLMGPIKRFSHEWAPGGGSVASLKVASGAVGTLHLCAGTAGASPLERVEVVGHDANVVAENGVRLTYYRPGASARPYGRSASFLVDDSAAPLLWEPEFSLGQLYNKNLFYLGYVPEVLHFCESVLTGKPPSKGTLADSLAIMELFEAYQRTPPGVVATLPVRS